MPELPEVETVKRGLQPAMEGARILSVSLSRSDLRFPFPDRFAKRLKGRRISGLSRRAKYLIANLDGPELLVMHLGMSGSFRVETDDGVLAPGTFHHPRSQSRRHDHVVFDLELPAGTAQVIYNDPRRFGYMELIAAAQVDSHPYFRGLGVEPTGNALDGTLLAGLFAGKKAPLKACLLDQRLIAGLGNIYVCEALWRARLSPRRKGETLTTKSGTTTDWAGLLAQSVRDVIAEAIAAGGSSLRDHRQTDGSLGYFQHSFSVYDREGQPCARQDCSHTVRRIVQSGRSTFYCPGCQR